MMKNSSNILNDYRCWRFVEKHLLMFSLDNDSQTHAQQNQAGS